MTNCYKTMSLLFLVHMFEIVGRFQLEICEFMHVEFKQ